jgi:hypothetical protein
MATLMLSVLVAGDQAGPTVIEKYKCSIDVPRDAGWEKQEVTAELAAKNVVFIAMKEDQESWVFLAVSAHPGSHSFDEKEIAEFKKGMGESATDHSMEIKFDTMKHLNIRGVPGISIASMMTLNDGSSSKVYSVARAFVANGNYYTLQAGSTKGPLTADPTQAKVLNSFDFIGEPTINSAPLLPFTDGTKSIEYQAGQITVVGLLILGFIIFVSIRIYRGSRSA